MGFHINILKVRSGYKIVEIAKKTWKPQFLPAVHGTIRRQFVEFIGKFSLSDKKFENFSIVQLFWKIYGCLDFDFMKILKMQLAII